MQCNAGKSEGNMKFPYDFLTKFMSLILIPGINGIMDIFYRKLEIVMQLKMKIDAFLVSFRSAEIKRFNILVLLLG